MAVIELDEINYLQRNSYKLVGLYKAKKIGIPVPEAVYLTEEEYIYYKKEGKISDECIRDIAKFVKKIELSNLPLLFSLRCETKGNKNVPRTPPSLLNIGILSRLYNLNYNLDNIENLQILELKSYWDRVRFYIEDLNHAPKCKSCIEEIITWLVKIYDKIEVACPHYVIIMRMVDGCFNKTSGVGICCNLPEDCNEKIKKFKGIYIPYSQGIPLVTGCWGKGECDILELAKINPNAYETIQKYYNKLEEKYGENPYFEFTVEGSKVYLLQYEKRRRFVVAGK